jgi:hypothetical protein
VLSSLIVDLDPLMLTAESFADHVRLGGGPAWQAAIDYGIDVTLLERNLDLSPTDRMRQHDEALRLYFEIRR